MGVSTDAKLIYGVPLSEDNDLEYDEESGVEEGPAWIRYSGDSENGIDIEHHCSDGHTMYFVAAHVTVAHRGYPKRIDSLTAPDGADKRIRAFVAKYNLKTDGEVGWWLASWWG